MVLDLQLKMRTAYVIVSDDQYISLPNVFCIVYIDKLLVNPYHDERIHGEDRQMKFKHKIKKNKRPIIKSNSKLL